MSRGPLEGASPALAGALALRFFLEIALLIGVAIVAWELASGGWRWVSALVAVVIVATLWGSMLSPKAKIPVAKPIAFMLEAALFLGTPALLLALGHWAAAVVGATLWAVDRAAIAMLQR